MTWLSRRRANQRSAVVLILMLIAQPLAPAVITVQGSCSLVEAIRAANTNLPNGGCPAGSGADTIVLTADVTLNAVEVSDDLGADGLPIVTSEITIEGQNHTIQRNPGALSDFRIVRVDAAGDLTLNRTTVSGGRTLFGFGAIPGSGGGFFNRGTLTLTNSTLSSNRAGQSGGAVYSRSGAKLYSHNTIFFGNRARESGGGGSYGGAILNGGYAKIEDSTFEQNLAGYLFGDIGRGGALFNFGEAVISGSTFTANRIFGLGGIGAAIEDSTLNGPLTLSNTTISGSQGPAGAVYSYSNAALPTVLTNVTFSGNDTYAFKQNVGGYTQSTATIFANTNGDNCDGGTFINLNSAADDTSCFPVPPGLTGLDPVLADNGGPTKTHALLAGSNAIEGAGFCSVPTDQRGAPRVGECDIGAFEYMGCPVLTLSDDTIVATETHEECSISIGPNFAVVGPGGDLTLRVGSTASFGDGFSVETDGELTVEHDGSLQLLLPELIEADRARRQARSERR